MKLKEKPVLRSNQLSSFIILNVYHPLKTEELDSVVNSILADPDKNDLNITHYIFIGNRLLITPIINKITDSYNIQWCGEYCIASYKLACNQYARYVPVARLNTGPMQSLEIHLKDLKILYIPKITNLSYIFDFLKIINSDVSDLDMICSCNTKYEGGDYQEWLHFEYHDENEPGLHYFVSDRNIERLNDEVIRYFKNKSFTECIIHIVDTKLEHLENCWSLENRFFKGKVIKRPRFKDIV